MDVEMVDVVALKNLEEQEIAFDFPCMTAFGGHEVAVEGKDTVVPVETCLRAC